MRPSKAAGPLSASQAQRAHIVEVVKQCKGNQSRAALALGMDRKTLRLKLRQPPLLRNDVPLLPQELTRLCQSRAEKAIRLAVGFLDDPEMSPRVRLKAAEMILDRGYGKPTEMVQGRISVESSPEERLARIAALMEVARQRSLTDGNGSEGHKDGQERGSQLGDGEEDGLK